MSITAPFKMTSLMTGDSTLVEISGSINEHAHFAEVRVGQKMKVNLAGVTSLNSVGTRSWCLWIQRFRAPIQIELDGCPPIMVKSISAIKGFITDRCRVNSFIIPYYSVETGESRDFLAIRGKHFDATGRMSLPEIKDSRGHTMEMDVVPEHYLAFLKP